jgi:hypothetical protein
MNHSVRKVMLRYKFQIKINFELKNNSGSKSDGTLQISSAKYTRRMCKTYTVPFAIIC